MDIPDTRYATTEDGISIAFQTVGGGEAEPDEDSDQDIEEFDE